MFKRKAPLTLLLITIFIIPLFTALLTPPPTHISPLHDHATLYKRETYQLSNWTATGDFEAWEFDHITEGAWDDTGAQVEFRDILPHSYTNFIWRTFRNDSTEVLKYYWLNWSSNITNTTSTTDYMQILIELYYNDTSYDVFTYYHYGEADGEAFVQSQLNITLDNTKYIDYIRFFAKGFIGGGRSPTLAIFVYEEVTSGVLGLHAPFNITMSDSSLRVGDSTTISCFINQSTEFLENVTDDIILNLVYIPSNQGTTINMTTDWTTPTYRLITITLNRSGAYRFFITHYYNDSTGYYNALNSHPEDSGLYGFDVISEDKIMFPEEAYLTIWTPLGYAIPNSLKVFLGESETHELFYPAIDANLTWRAYANNSYDHPITYSYSDNKVLFSAVDNGIEADIPTNNGSYPNIETYESLVFTIKITAFRSSEGMLIIGLNDLSADYYLPLESGYLNEWIQFIIPFCQFTWRYYQAALAEVQFLGDLTCQLKNIFIADYKNLSTMLTNEVNYTSDYNVSTTAYNTSPLDFTTANQTAAISGFINTTSWENKTYDLNCENNTLLESAANTSAAASENETGHYLSKYSFRNDAIGADPADWIITEGAGCSVQVISDLANHSKIVECNDTGAGSFLLQQNFSATQTTGTVELWGYPTTSATAAISIYLRDSSGTNGMYLQFYMTETTLRHFNPSTVDIDVNVPNSVWHHLKIIFDCTSDTFQIWLNGVENSTDCAFQNDIASVKYIYVQSWAAGTGYGFNLDAVDYSWASGYYDNRNMNQSQLLNETITLSYPEIPTNINNITLTANVTYDHTPNNFTIGYYNFTASDFDYFVKNTTTFTETLSSAYFNSTTLQFRLNTTNESPFYLAYNLSVSVSYWNYENVSTLYYYQLSTADYYYFYNLTLNETEQANTTASLYWAYSTDNASWSAWSSNTAINAYGAEFLLYKINCNTTAPFYNTSSFYGAYLYLDFANDTFYIDYNITRAFSYASLIYKNLYLLNTVTNISNLINSSVSIYNFTSNAFENISAINYTAPLNYSLSSDYWNSTYYVIENFKIYAPETFTLNFTSAYLQLMNWTYDKYCYIDHNITDGGYNSSFDILVIHFDFSSAYSTSTINFAWQFTNGTYYTVATYPQTSTYPYLPRAEVFYLYTDYDITGEDLQSFRFTFYADSNGVNVSELCNVSKMFFVGDKSYRLYSDENRQHPTNLVFDSENETLLLTDFFGNFIHKTEYNRTAEGAFIDVMVNFWEITFSNLVKDTTCSFYIENRNLNITITLQYGQSVTIGLFTDDYVVVLWDDENLRVINRWDVTITRTQYRTFSYSIEIPVDPGDGGGISISEVLSNEYFLFFILFIGITAVSAVFSRRQSTAFKETLRNALKSKTHKGSGQKNDINKKPKTKKKDRINKKKVRKKGRAPLY